MDVDITVNFTMDYQYYHHDGGSYTQAPFEDCTKETYEKMILKSLTSVDLSNVIELSDETDLSGELACAGGACEIK
jgi:ribonucleoside-triphosphate reductase (thioredoxin)